MKSLNKDNFSFYKKEPYLIFEIKDFMEKDKFEILKKSFPEKKYFIDSEDRLTKKIFGCNFTAIYMTQLTISITNKIFYSHLIILPISFI